MATPSASAGPRHEHYDAVIVGAGMGGLTCATYLARRGLRVLVCEKERRAGGLLSTLRRKGFLFDLTLPSLSSAGLVFHVLDDLGIRQEFEFLEAPYRLMAPHFDFVARTTDDVVRSLSQAFPEEKSGIRAYFSLLQRIAQEIAVASTAENPILKEGKERLQAFVPFLFDSRGLFLDYFRYKSLLAERRIRNLIHNEDLRNFLITVGYPRHKSILSDALVWNALTEDAYYPKGGMGRLARVLQELVRKFGGEVMLDTPVKRILVDRGRAAGVELGDGTRVASRFVVSNADYKQTFTSLVPQERLPARFRRRIQEARVSESFFTAFLGVRLPPEKLLGGTAANVLHFPTYMYVDFQRADRDEAYFQKAWQCISVPSLLDPGLAPAGKSVVVIRTWTTSSYLDGWSGGARDGESSPSYRRLKERVGRDVIASAESVIPGLGSHVEVCELATPVTLARMTGNSEGAVTGWSIDPLTPFYRDILRQVQGFLTPIPNLLLAGHWTAHPGGLPVALASGRWVADRISAHLRTGSFWESVPLLLRAPAERAITKSLSILNTYK